MKRCALVYFIQNNGHLSCQRDHDSCVHRDAIALMVTVLLGIVSFAVQGKLSKDVEAAQRTTGLAQVEREKERHEAEGQLDKGRVQVGPA